MDIIWGEFDLPDDITWQSNGLEGTWKVAHEATIREIKYNIIKSQEWD